MRFGLKCVIVLAILYRAIIVSQGGTDTAALSSALAAVPRAQANLHDEISSRVAGWCRGDPAACLDHATRLTRFVSGDPLAIAATSRHQGAMPAPAR